MYQKRVLKCAQKQFTSRTKLTSSTCKKQKTCYTKLPLNHLHPTKSINPTKVKGTLSLNNLAPIKTKEEANIFSFCIGKKSSLTTILFLGFHIVQNKQEGVACQTFFLLLPTKHLSNPKESPSLSLT